LDRPHSTHVERWKINTKFQSENLKRRDHFQYLGANGGGGGGILE
jgi:hypothetical protein